MTITNYNLDLLLYFFTFLFSLLVVYNSNNGSLGNLMGM